MNRAVREPQRKLQLMQGANVIKSTLSQSLAGSQVFQPIARQNSCKHRMSRMWQFGSKLLKYFPAFLAVTLIVGWLVSQFVRVGVAHAIGKGDALYVLTDGMFTHTYCRPKVGWDSFFVYPQAPTNRRYIGQLKYLQSSPPDHWLNSPAFRLQIHLPITMIITALLPLAIGPFIRYRFPLWSWLAFLTLICCELAFYL